MVHSKELSEENFKLISKSFPELEFEDASWCHDSADSILSEKFGIQVYFPNCKVLPKEPCVHDFSTFCIAFYTSCGIMSHKYKLLNEKYENKTYNTTEEVIEEIKIILKKEFNQ